MTSEQPFEAPDGQGASGARGAPATPTAGVPPRVVLLGRAGCHLCDEARVVVERVAAELGVGWEERSVDDDPELLRRYAEQIPVTFVDGRRHDFWRVDEARLRAALR
jgi:hypothetical protein